MELSSGYRRAACCLVVIALAYVATPAVFDLDDAYIALHSARVAVSGSDAVYGAPALIGITSPAYVAVLIGAMVAGMGDVQALRVVTALGLAAYVVALWRLGGALKLSARHRFILLVLTLGSGLVLMQATNGLETGWALALLTGLIAEAIDGHLYTTAAGAALLPFLRPDLAPASALLMLSAARGAGWPQRLKAAGLALACAAPLLLWMRADTAAWAPQTMHAKELFFAEACAPLALKTAVVFHAVSTFLITVAPLALFAIVLVRDRLGRYGLLAIGLTLAAFLLRFSAGLSHNDFRYLYAIVVPWLSLGVGVRLSRGGRLAGVPATLLLVVATLAIWPFVQPARARAAHELVSAAEWIDRNIPEDAVVLVHDAGAISTFAHRRVVDLVGLKTVSSIAAHRQWTAPSCGRDRGRAIGAIALASHASYAMIVSDWDETFELRSALESSGFVLTPVRVPPPDSRGYTVYRMTNADVALSRPPG